ncbi:U3 small nucleolar RNA-associated protein 14 [Triticum urartu]|uniref:U3 small nucleolar RNA-associated protein 14 n=1 Tax=Triticum urartu TaxID=4572 RepID=M7YL73_TRIUA|nr:U3 small nucleolar RNA-associated protein 14 [Triticum urartu]
MGGTKPNAKARTNTLTPRASRGTGRGRGRGRGRGGAGRPGEKRSHGPHLPNKLRRELESLGPARDRGSDNDDDDEDDVVGEDVYEYEEGVPEEEARKNDRYDAVAKYEYDFDSDGSNADEDVPSDEGEDMEEDDDGDDKPGYSKIRKMVQQQEKKPMVVQPPLPKGQRDKMDRSVAYVLSKKEIGKWERIVKDNREAATLRFENDLNLGVDTVGAIASKFEPRSSFEKQMASVFNNTEIMEAHKNDGAKILELNKMEVEDVRERQNRLAKMRSLLFRHEMKAKRVKKIKSRTFHRLLKKDKLKAADLEADPEAAKDSAKKLEFKRAEERMTLKHKNNSKWAKRILKRGLSVQDDGTRDAITAQLQQHALLTRKMNSIKDGSSSSDESSDDDDDDEEDESKLEAKLLNRGKEKIRKVIEEDNEIPKSGVFSLPFMERAMKKRADATYEETRLDYEELEESLRKLEDDNTEENVDSMKVTGKRTFGPVKRAHEEANKRPKLGDADKNSDSEYDSDSGQHFDSSEVNKKAEYANNKADDVQLGTALLDDEQQNDLYVSFDGTRKSPGPKTDIEVRMLADNSWKKVKNSKTNGGNNIKESGNNSKVQIPSVDSNPKQPHNSDSDSEEEMVDGFLTVSDEKETYELPSQADLIRQAFAGDDVEAEFVKDKVEALNEENPEPEEPALVPGWGQWTHVQQKRGLPSWMVKEHEDAKRKREETLKSRKDAKLKHVIISEHVDKKAEKLLATNLPFPYTSNDVYENSMRMPLGPDFNPAISLSALNRPAIVKKPGVVIKPIQYGEIDPHEKPDELKRVIQRVKPNPNIKKASAKQAKRTASHRRT